MSSSVMIPPISWISETNTLAKLPLYKQLPPFLAIILSVSQNFFGLIRSPGRKKSPVSGLTNTSLQKNKGKSIRLSSHLSSVTNVICILLVILNGTAQTAKIPEQIKVGH
jgi:hypothetical protein